MCATVTALVGPCVIIVSLHILQTAKKSMAAIGSGKKLNPCLRASLLIDSCVI
jgi:hypothetical protein